MKAPVDSRFFHIVLFKLYSAMKVSVKVLMSCILFYLNSFIVKSQPRFMYIQADTEDAFSVQLNQNKYTSDSERCIIIPKLAKAEYSLFLISQNQEKQFVISIVDKDLSLLIKNNGESWVLLNVINDHIIQPQPAILPTLTGKIKTNSKHSFGNVLADVINDIEFRKYIELASNNKTSTQTTSIKVKAKDSAQEKQQLIAIQQQELDIIEPNNETSGIIKAAQEEKKEGIEIVFYDFNSKATDTINIFIPIYDTAISIVQNNTDEQQITKDIKAADTTSINNDSLNKDGFDNFIVDVKHEKPITDSISNPFKSSNVDTANTPSTKNVSPNCKQLAIENDFIKLRRRMALQPDETAMLQIAKKALKTKCYTTEFIKNLGALYLNDQYRYQFFEMAYPYVYDPSNYHILETQLIDTVYKEKLYALLQ